MARQAQVSTGTVSKYLNHQPIRAANREKIEKAIDALGYRVNASARALKTSRSATVGVLLPDIAGVYSPKVVREIENCLYREGYSVLIADAPNVELEEKKLRLMLDRMVDGIIVFPLSGSYENYQYILDQDVPLCIVDQYLPGIPCPQIVSDNVMAVHRATTELLNAGCGKIAVITGPQENSTAMERLRGYRSALESFGITPEPELICTAEFTEEGGYRAFERLMELPDRPDGVIACNHGLTAGVVMCALDKGISFPRDMALVGFDYAGLPKLTRMEFGVIEQSIHDIAQAAVMQLMRRIRGESRAGELLLQRIPTMMDAPKTILP